MTRPAWTRGKAVVNHELQYVSPSQIVGADHDAFGGCLRRWFYRRVEGRPEPTNASAELGTECHAQVEEYLTTGRMVLGQHALSLKPYLPAPSSTHLVEVPIDDGTLTLAGLPVVGFIDWLNDTGRIELDEGEQWDLQPSAEVVDWKFTGRRDFPSSAEVASSTPMIIYGEWVARKRDLEWVRLSHVYSSTRRRYASKRSLLVPRADLSPKLERAEGIVRRLVQAAKCLTADEVDANTDACTAYGGCPHRSVCGASNERSLIDLLGASGAARILNTEKDMSLLNIPALAAMKSSPVDDAKAALIAEEKAAKVDPAVKAAVEAIRASGYGQPTLGGEAAKAWAAVVGLDFQGHGLAGSGMLAQANISDPADLIRAAEELKGLPAPQQAGGLLPPDAPASDPVKAAAALEPKVATPAEVAMGEMVATIEVMRASQSAAGPAPTEDSGELKLSKKARAYVEELLTRVQKAEWRCAELEAQALTSAPLAAPTAAPAPAGIELYVDCFPPSGASDLMSWIQEQADRLAKQYGAADVRCAPNDSPLGFGRWKGALAALCREAPLQAGVYCLDARGSDLAEVAVEALRARARVVRGMR